MTARRCGDLGVVLALFTVTYGCAPDSTRTLQLGYLGNGIPVAWQPNMATIACGTWSNEWALVDPNAGTVIKRFRGHTGWVLSIDWSLDGSHVATGSGDCSVKVWDVQKDAPLRTMYFHTKLVTAVSWNRDGKRLAAGSSDWNVSISDPNTGTETAKIQGAPTMAEALVSSIGELFTPNHLPTNRTVRDIGHSRDLHGVRWSRDGVHLATVGYDGQAKLWDFYPDRVSLMREFTVTRGLLPGQKPVFSIDWSPDAKVVFTGDEQDMLSAFNVSTGKKLWSVRAHNGDVFSVAAHPTGHYVATGGQDSIVRVWDSGSGRVVNGFKIPTKRVMSVAWSSDGNRLAAGGVDGNVYIWSVNGGTVKSIRVRQ